MWECLKYKTHHKVTTAVHPHECWTSQTIEELWNMFAIYHCWRQGHSPNTQFFGETHVDFSADNLYAGKFKRNWSQIFVCHTVDKEKRPTFKNLGHHLWIRFHGHLDLSLTRAGMNCWCHERTWQYTWYYNALWEGTRFSSGHTLTKLGSGLSPSNIGLRIFGNWSEVRSSSKGLYTVLETPETFLFFLPLLAAQLNFELSGW